MVPSTTLSLQAAKRQVRKDGKTIHLDGGNGWTTVVVWDWMRKEVRVWSINPEGMRVF